MPCSYVQLGDRWYQTRAAGSGFSTDHTFNRSERGFVRMSNSLKKGHILTFVLLSTVAFAAKLPKADKVLAEAETRAAAKKKNVMLVFESSWCPPCQEFEKFVADPKIHSIFDRYFVLTTVAVGEEVGGNASKNNPGSEELLFKLGGVHYGNTGVPFIFVIDPQGSIVVTSERPITGKKTGDNVGYPTEPEEIDWFVKMVKKGTPSLTEDDARTIVEWLREEPGS
jgi:thiol-disulfide isomerase/thioredoxin